MGRKKKIIEEVEFIPSKYQKDIFDVIEHGVGNIVIEAAAGSGKTSTLIKAIKLIPIDKRILFCAFNTDIVKELKRKIKDSDNVDIRTVHSLGYLMIQRNLNKFNIPINENKYRTYVMGAIKHYTSLNLFKLDKPTYLKYIDNICKLIDFCRYNLVDTPSLAELLVEMHDIDIIGDEVKIALEMLKWGKEELSEIDYTDMVWLPNVLYMKPIGLQYDFIFGDEAQDFSVAQRELLLKCQKMGTRYVFCGDKNQCIYSFASASPDTFDKLKTLPNTTVLPLSISYRCAKNIVKFAQNIVPSIEPNNDEREGEILYDVPLEAVEDGDMVICRNNAPLMEAYNEFIREGKKCYIRGKDIGLNLKKLVESAKQEKLNADLSNDGVFVRLYDKLFSDRDKLIKKTGLDRQTVMNSQFISNKLDMIHALEVLSEGIETSTELIEKIKSVFSDKKISGIALSTIHKAKGLEANNVYIACKSLMPSRSATKKWEVEQEKNLMYVAFTRAKNKLGFIDEKLFTKTNRNASESLKKIEATVCNILGKKVSQLIENKEIAKIIANNVKPIEIIPTTASVTLGKKKKSGMANLITKKLTKRN